MFSRAVMLSRGGLPPRAMAMATRSLSVESATFTVEPFKTHLVDAPDNTVTATKEELMHYYMQMNTIRRMEIACDNEYKMRNIRGFCHLYDGQEAVGVGCEAGTTRDDDWITSYRCHATALLRGSPVAEILAELFGYSSGVVKGKGGSMHMYNREANFWGGCGIVGAQVPLGVGVAFANKYNADQGKAPLAISMAYYGDGAANQGQIWESANMAKLWNLPALFVCENNQYGMGTSIDRHSSCPDYYKMGQNVIPGIQANGMDVLAVKRAFEFARQHCLDGNGPMFMELKTYRYHGHSMSDPGDTYRTKDEVKGTRDTKDCILTVKNMLLESGMAEEAELKAVEKQARAEVTAAVKEAKQGVELPVSEIYTDIYHKEVPKFIRGAEMATSAYH